MGVLRIAGAIAVVLVAGCLEPSVVQCEDGTVCPTGSVCRADGCALQEQLEACEGLDDGAPCSYSGVPEGACVDGACESFACGNGIEEPEQGEVCDDGNTDSGDGCRGDCQKEERCGDGELDLGEACDDQNANPADGCGACQLTTWTAAPIVGGEIDGITVGLGEPEAVAFDEAGRLYIADTYNQKIRRLDPVTGTIVTVAGNGEYAIGGDGAAATRSPLFNPFGLAVDGIGAIYIADQSNRVRRVDPTSGVITTIAGNGTSGSGGDDGPATSAQLSLPEGLALDGLGNVYIADAGNGAIRRVDAATGLIASVAGATGLQHPTGVALDDVGNLYVADGWAHRVYRVDPLGVRTTYAGNGVAGGQGDGGLATAAEVDTPYGVAVDRLGDVYIAEQFGHRVRRVDAVTKIITTVAGTGAFGFDADGIPADTAQLWEPRGVAVSPAGRVAIADCRNQRVRAVDDAGLIQTIAGTGGFGVSGDGGAATSAQLHFPSGVEVEGTALYLVEQSAHRVRRVDLTTGVITTVAGTAIPGFSGDGGLATAARLNTPLDLAVHGDDLYVVELYHRVRHVDLATGIITTLAGNGAQGYDGDGGPAADATLFTPSGVDTDAAGNVYVADFGNHTVRRIDATTGIITTVVGTGAGGDSGDGVRGVNTIVEEPYGVAVDAAGNLYFTELTKGRLRRVDAVTELVSTPATGFAMAMGLGVDASGDVYVADRSNQRVRRVVPGTGAVTTVAGTLGQQGSLGDGGSATDAWVSNAEGVTVGPDGTVYVADTHAHRVRRVDPETGVITTVAGAIDPEGMGPLESATLAEPTALARGAAFSLVAGGSTGTVQVLREATGVLEAGVGRYPQVVVTADLARFRSGGFGEVGGVALDEAAGLIYLTETTFDRIDVVTIVDPDDVDTWTIAPLAIDGTLRAPTGLFLDGGILYVADTGDHAVRAIALADGSITTLAGTPGTLGFFGDTGAATAALLYRPEAIARCGNGDFFIADTGNNRVRRIDAAGTITTVLGDGVAASSGQGQPATEFPVRAPRGLACDGLGNLYVTSTTTIRQVAADDDGVVDGTLAVASLLRRDDPLGSVTSCLTGLEVIDDATVRATDACTGILVELTRDVP